MNKNRFIPRLIFLVAVLVLNACAASKTVAPANTETAASDATFVAAQTEAVASNPTPVPSGKEPASGETFHIALNGDPDTLDPNKTVSGTSDTVMSLIGASLVSVTPDLSYEPYLAESWTVSEDGLIWDFKLRQDVKYSDGTPFTANDYVFTFKRALDPETASPSTGPNLSGVVSVEAVDDYTLRLTLSEPNAPFLYNLADPGYMQPINQALFEKIGEENYGRSPVSVGPFIFKEWETGDKIVLQQNPDFNWGPNSWMNQGPFKIQTIVFDIIPDYSTILAGLESGEIDKAIVEPQDSDRFESNDSFQMFSTLFQGISPYVTMNVSKPPFDDVRVRKAFNLAVDKQALIDVVIQGNGIVQYGYLSPSVMGYWPGVEQIGYQYDLDQAKELMKEAGYTLNSEGILEKDGQPLSLNLDVSSNYVTNTKTAQVLEEQYAQLGVKININQLEAGVLYSKYGVGDYQIGIADLGWGEADLLYFGLHSSQIGACNFSMLKDPDLDTLLEKSRTTTDIDARQEVLNQIQQKVIEQAYVIPLFAAESYYAVSSRWQDVKFSPSIFTLIDLSGAHLSE